MVSAVRARPLSGEHRRVVRALRALAAPSGAVGLSEYLGSPVPVLGVRTPALRSVVHETVRRFRGAPRRQLRALARALWQGRTFEEKMVAIELMGRPPLVDDEAAWRLCARWVDAATGWALSDSLAAGPLASQVRAHPERFPELLRWARSENIWRRRASAYALRAWVRSGELDRPFELLERLLDDPERWVQRAVGTWLRECWKKDQQRTERFLRREVNRLTPVAITVATERAPKRFREELRHSARRRRDESSAGRRRF
jgi:3-methyladenine DNA glycosylase AlkD